MLFCVGEFFGKTNCKEALQPYIDGFKKVPIPTYFILGDEAGNTELIDGLPLGGSFWVPNLHYLGREGIKEVGENVKVAFLSGVFKKVEYNAPDSSERQSKYSSSFIKAEVDSLLQLYQDEHKGGVDILLTSNWPQGFPTDKSPTGVVGCPIIKQLCSSISTRYHFAGEHGKYFQMKPYKDQTVGCTRFFALGRHGEDKSQKSLYAFNYTPVVALESTQLEPPADATNHPYKTASVPVHTGTASTPSSLPPTSAAQSQVRQRSATDSLFDDAKTPSEREEPLLKKAKLAELDASRFDGNYGFGSTSASASYNRWGLNERTIQSGRVPPPSYVCKICQTRGHFIQDCPQKKERNPGRSYEGKESAHGGKPLLANPNFNRNAECWFCLGATGVKTHMVVSISSEAYLALAKGPLTPDHMLLLPMDHINSFLELPAATKVRFEEYKAALRKCFAAQGKTAIFYERHMPTRGTNHMHLQVLPIPNQLASTAKDRFVSEAQAAGVDFEEMPSSASLESQVGGGHFLYVEFSATDRILHRVSPTARIRGLFAVQRNIFANIIGQPHKADWKQCDVSEAEETAMVAQLKSGFKPFFKEADSDSDSDSD
eukprot:CAMPEP_0175145052 /NCGR_PEP_ID=MMETSP0087-20121206/14524_1 /TAXON_ID=136419 /ORGANISM="Unknown Unknown, Strain D1" /LENGTH=600 /DNA_ID=CAMNT_0016429691 /DNA_START=93 /DNA_END=1895 /DNA_ORIENTATION=-